MIRELINFTQTLLSDDFKSLGAVPKGGLHILVRVDNAGNIITSGDSIEYEYYSKKMDEVSPLLRKCMQLQENAWCVNTNKCFDLPMKAMHTCSPVCMAFKREHIEGGKKYESNLENEKSQIYERFAGYFDKAHPLIDADDDFQKNAFESFSRLFVNGGWKVIYEDIERQREGKSEILKQKEENINERIKSAGEKSEKGRLKDELNEWKRQSVLYQPLSDSDYILFYLDLPLSVYKEMHGRYLDDKLFNTADYNTEPNGEGLIYGTNDFQNGFNSKMPFLLHQTATFDITGRISNIDARMLYDFGNVLPRKSLPNPLPVFIYNDEFKKRVIALYEEGKKSFRETIQDLYQSHSDDFQNYYLLNWTNTQNGIVFNDYDFVSKFEYKINPPEGLVIGNYFELFEKDGKRKGLKHYAPVKTIFELEDRVLKYLIQNKYLRVDYFSDFKKEDYEGRDMTFLSYGKYRKGIYDYVYKSNRNAIGGKEFDELIFNSIKDDIKNSKEYGIKEKLNLWYSLYEYFHKPKNIQTSMASKLKAHQNFVSDLLSDQADIENATDGQFAFAAGQVIYYLLDKSKSSDTSYRLMEPYLRKTNCKALQENISEDFSRYKHENFSGNFRKVAAFVLSYETDQNIKKLQPELLSGLFTKNQLFSNQSNNENE